MVKGAFAVRNEDVGDAQFKKNAVSVDILL